MLKYLFKFGILSNLSLYVLTLSGVKIFLFLFVSFPFVASKSTFNGLVLGDRSSDTGYLESKSLTYVFLTLSSSILAFKSDF